MELHTVNDDHFDQIIKLIKTPEEMYLVYPSGTFPFDQRQLKKLQDTRAELTVGVVDGEVACFANLYDLTAGTSGFIGNIIVDSRHRAKGYGRLILSHMVEVLLGKYEAEPHLSVFGYNIPAINLYKSFGFRPYDVELRDDFNGNPVALFHMKYER